MFLFFNGEKNVNVELNSSMFIRIKPIEMYHQHIFSFLLEV